MVVLQLLVWVVLLEVWVVLVVQVVLLVWLCMLVVLKGTIRVLVILLKIHMRLERLRLPVVLVVSDKLVALVQMQLVQLLVVPVPQAPEPL